MYIIIGAHWTKQFPIKIIVSDYSGEDSVLHLLVQPAALLPFPFREAGFLDIAVSLFTLEHNLQYAICDSLSYFQVFSFTN